MRLVLQRVKRGAVTIDEKETRSIGCGLVVLVGVCPADNEDVCAYMADKAAQLRIFDDENGDLNRSLLDVGGDCLVVSNFTLYAQCKKGRRPSFIEAAPPAQAEALYQSFVRQMRRQEFANLQTGEFGAYMEIDMACDGPVTILLDSDVIMPKKRKEDHSK